MGDASNPFRAELLPLERGLKELMPLLQRLHFALSMCTDEREAPDAEDWAKFTSTFTAAGTGLHGFVAMMLEVDAFIQISRVFSGDDPSAEVNGARVVAVSSAEALEELLEGPETAGPSHDDGDEGGGGHEPS
jgi:hypothetical protein